MNLKLIGLVGLTVRVKIDETRCDDQAPDVDDGSALERLGRNLRNPIAANADVAHRIETALRIHDSPPGEYDVETSRGRLGVDFTSRKHTQTEQ
jgi:hypothetical protein